MCSSRSRAQAVNTVDDEAVPFTFDHCSWPFATRGRDTLPVHERFTIDLPVGPCGRFYAAYVAH